MGCKCPAVRRPTAVWKPRSPSTAEYQTHHHAPTAPSSNALEECNTFPVKVFLLSPIPTDSCRPLFLSLVLPWSDQPTLTCGLMARSNIRPQNVFRMLSSKCSRPLFAFCLMLDQKKKHPHPCQKRRYGESFQESLKNGAETRDFETGSYQKSCPNSIAKPRALVEIYPEILA